MPGSPAAGHRVLGLPGSLLAEAESYGLEAQGAGGGAAKLGSACRIPRILPRVVCLAAAAIR